LHQRARARRSGGGDLAGVGHGCEASGTTESVAGKLIDRFHTGRILFGGVARERGRARSDSSTRLVPVRFRPGVQLIMPDVDIDAGILKSVASMVRRARASPNMELETRIGVVRDGRFDARIPRTHMDELLPALQEFARTAPERLVQRHGEWREEDNYYFKLGKRQLRTRVADDEVVHSTIEKRAVDVMLLRTLTFDVKVCLSEEIPVPATDVPSVAATNHVRAKQVCRFWCPKASLEVSCAAVWAGGAQSEVELAQRETEPFFELECELLPRNLSGGETDAYLAKSLLLKTANLMMTPGQRYELVSPASNSASRKRVR